MSLRETVSRNWLAFQHGLFPGLGEMVYGILLTVAAGGADTPVTIALLNS